MVTVWSWLEGLENEMGSYVWVGRCVGLGVGGGVEVRVTVFASARASARVWGWVLVTAWGSVTALVSVVEKS